MNNDAKRGFVILTIITFLVIVGEVFLLGFRFLTIRLSWSDLVRVLLTIWLLWNTWKGASWARWIVAVLYLLATGLGVYYFITDPRILAKTTAIWLFGSLVAALFLMGLGLALPWVGAFQAHQRNREA